MRYIVSPRNKRGAFPKLMIGDRVGDFVINSYIGQSTVHPGTAKILSKDHHWYRAKCDCGNVEIRTQQQLTDKRRIQSCADCLQTVIRNL